MLEAEADLRGIIRYTRQQWSDQQVRVYIGRLERGIARLGDVMNQVRTHHRRPDALQHHLAQGLAHDNLKVNGRAIVLRLAGRHLDGVLLDIHRRLRPRHNILTPLQAQKPQAYGTLGAFDCCRNPVGRAGAKARG